MAERELSSSIILDAACYASHEYNATLSWSVQILRKLKHENIIEMLDSFETPEEFCVVTEFAQVQCRGAQGHRSAGHLL